MDLDCPRRLEGRRVLRRDEDVLRRVRGLGNGHHEVERLLADNGVHEDVELVEAPDRASDSVPKREQESDRRKRLFASRQLIGVFLLCLRRPGVEVVRDDLGGGREERRSTLAH